MNKLLDAIVVTPPASHTASVIWLHGLGADGHDFEALIPALDLGSDHGIKFIFPNAPMRPIAINNGMVMRGWYDVRDMDLTLEEDLAGIEDSVAIIERFIDQEVAANIGSERIILAGFSQGGAIALYGGLRHAQPLAGIMALSTYLPLPDQLATQAHPANANTPIFMAHGQADPVIPMFQGQRTSDLLNDQGYPVEWHSYPMQHAVCPEEVRDIRTWVKGRL